MYVELMVVYVAGIYAHERWNIFSKIANLAWDLVLAAWCAMMRHTGDPVYTYKARRYQ